MLERRQYIGPSLELPLTADVILALTKDASVIDTAVARTTTKSIEYLDIAHNSPITYAFLVNYLIIENMTTT